jgi:hypothetical protein
MLAKDRLKLFREKKSEALVEPQIDKTKKQKGWRRHSPLSLFLNTLNA